MVEAPRAFTCALLFHDVVYEPTAGDNEERSADAAEAAISSLLAGHADAHALATRVRRLIMATKHLGRSRDADGSGGGSREDKDSDAGAATLGATAAGGDASGARDPLSTSAPPSYARDEALLVDIDLSILGAAAPSAFAAYEAGIRHEYRHYDDAAYRAGRLAVLRMFQAKPRIFATQYWRERLEAQARANLAAAIAALEEGEGAAGHGSGGKGAGDASATRGL
jgi:predicted metal-dependent HD superfamily phosphohydrolase